MAFTIGSGTFTNGSATVTNVSLSSGTLAYFASGTRMVVGTNPVVQEVEAIAAPTVTTITLRNPWSGTGGTYDFLANQTSEGLRDAVQSIRTANSTLQEFIDSISTTATANSVAQRTSNGSLNTVELRATGTIQTTSGGILYNPSSNNGAVVIRDLGGSAANNGVEMHIRPSSGKSAYISFTEDSVADVASIGISAGTNALLFKTGSSIGTERMRIDSSGNVGIGTSSPAGWGTTLQLSDTAADSGIVIEGNARKWGIGGGFSGDAGSLRFYDFTAAAERMRIDSSGNVGIGTSSPSAKLDIVGNDGRITLAQSVSAGTNKYGRLCGHPFSSENLKTFVIGYHNTNSSNDINIGGSSGALAQANTIRLHTTSVGQNTAGATERMRIDSSGNVLVGTTASSTAKLTSYSNNTAGADAAYLYSRSTGAGGAAAVMRVDTTAAYYSYFLYQGIETGSINTNGAATNYNTISDYRLKEDWQPMEGNIDRLMQLKPCNFAWKVDGRRVDGFLAHEAQEVVPEAVTGEKDAMRTEQYEVEPAVYEDVVIPAEFDGDGNEISPERTEQKLVKEAVMGEREVPEYQGIDQAKLVPLLTAALQDAVKKIDALEARIEALES